MEKVIVAGAGRWGINHVRTFYELGVLAGIVESNQETHKELSLKFPGIPLFIDIEQALKTNAVGFVIATPAPTHFSLAKQIMFAGKDVLVEKPMTLSYQEAELLVEIAKATNRILMVGHLLLYQPAIQIIKNLLNERAIGTLRSIHQQRMKLGRVRSVENVMWSFGVHDIAVLLYLIGETPSSLIATGQKAVQPKIEDDTYLHMTFKNGVQAHLRTSWLWPVQERSMVISGTKGFLVYEENKQVVTLYRKGINNDLQNWDHGAEIVYQGREEDPLKNECKHFLSCIRTRSTPLSDGLNGKEVVSILEQATLLLDKGDFISD